MANHKVEITDENEDWLQAIRKKKPKKTKDEKGEKHADDPSARVAARFVEQLNGSMPRGR